MNKGFIHGFICCHASCHMQNGTIPHLKIGRAVMYLWMQMVLLIIIVKI